MFSPLLTIVNLSYNNILYNSTISYKMQQLFIKTILETVFSFLILVLIICSKQ